MTLATGRADRRRRILNDGRLAGDGGSSATSEGEPSTGGAPRYTLDPTSVSQGLAGKVLPTGAWSMTGVAFAGLVLIAGLAAGEFYRPKVAAAAGQGVANLLAVESPLSLAALLIRATAASVVLLAGVVYGLRRGRSDDLRGAYRWWLVGVAAAALVTVCLATGAHGVAAKLIAQQVAWSPLAGDAFWWLAPATLVLGAVAARLFFDLKESLLAAASSLLAVTGAGVAIAAWQGWAPEAATPYLSIAEFVGAEVAFGGMAFAMLAYCRRIVREAEGRVAAPTKPIKAKSKSEANADADRSGNAPGRAKPTRAKQTTAPRIAAEIAQAKPQRSDSTATSRAASQAATSTEWVDGSQGADDDYGDDGGPRRKLSKAERKRLRKQKARQGRAA